MILDLHAHSIKSDDGRAKVQNYLRGSGFRLGLLVNFGHHPLVAIERFAL